LHKNIFWDNPPQFLQKGFEQMTHTPSASTDPWIEHANPSMKSAPQFLQNVSSFVTAAVQRGQLNSGCWESIIPILDAKC
jgi:hypothetical protein